MICPSCGKENKAEAGICKHCSAALGQKYKTCKNGHNYELSLNECPYCPGSEVSTVFKTSTDSRKTVIDKQAEMTTEPEIFAKKENTLTSAASPVPSQKTVIEKEPKKEKPVPGSSSTPKLVGWLVTYDLEPAGIDFKLYEGRTKIGRTDFCNVLINDASVSEEHSLLFYNNNKFIIQDELSESGTFVNGKRIEERTNLNDGDQIKVGNISFIIKFI
jgi:hypothetical protein